MRKHIINPGPQDISLANQHWLNLDALADVEVTSEDAAHPKVVYWVECAARTGDRHHNNSTPHMTFVL